MEDWQGEKCDVSLLEGINPDLIIHMLDRACDLLRQSDLSKDQVEALCDRLLLRKVGMRLRSWRLARSHRSITRLSFSCTSSTC